MHDLDARAVNLLVAWSLVVAEAVTEATERETGLGGAVPSALVTIAAYRDQTIEDLRGALRLSQPGTVRLVDRLVAAGWVQRRAGRRPRTVALALTPAGRDVTGRLLAAREQAVRALVQPVDRTEAAALAHSLERLLHARGAAGRDPQRVCRLCERDVCEACPVAAGSHEGPPHPRS
jgi:MarR family transcriptional repressor of emrRAB